MLAESGHRRYFASMSQKVLITRRVPDVAQSLLKNAEIDAKMLDVDDPPARDTVLANLRGCSGVITMMSDRVDEDFLDAAGESLRVVAQYAVGYDNIDLDACRKRGVCVTNTPGVLTEATADIAWALIMSCARRVIEGDAKVREGRWTGWYPMELLGMELLGATLGIVGAGRIGTATARRALGFGMKVCYTHPRTNAFLESKLAAKRVELDQLIRECDVVSLHIPMRPENRHLLNKDRIGAMKDGAILINTARGPVVDEAALVAELRTGRIRAGLDVYEHEPKLTPGLAELSNVVLMPHLGSGTVQTREKMARMCAESIVAVLRGEEPENVLA